MNKVILIGNVYKNPEISIVGEGLKKASLTLSVYEGKDKEGKIMKQYFNLTAWGKVADFAESYVKDGMALTVQAKLKNSSWDKPDGTKGYATNIIVDSFDFVPKNFGPKDTVETAKQSAPKTEVTKDTVEDLPNIDVANLNINMPF